MKLHKLVPKPALSGLNPGHGEADQPYHFRRQTIRTSSSKSPPMKTNVYTYKCEPSELLCGCCSESSNCFSSPVMLVEEFNPICPGLDDLSNGRKP